MSQQVQVPDYGQILLIKRSNHINGLDWAYNYKVFTPDEKIPEEHMRTKFTDGINAIGIIGITVNEFNNIIKRTFPRCHEIYGYGFTTTKVVSFDGAEGIIWQLPPNYFYNLICDSLWNIESTEGAVPNLVIPNKFLNTLIKLARDHTLFIKGITYSSKILDENKKSKTLSDIKYCPYPDYLLRRTNVYLENPKNVQKVLDSGICTSPDSESAPFPISAFQRDCSKIPTLSGLKEFPLILSPIPALFDFFDAICETTIMV
jgi:hypothetical protein